MGVEAPGGQGVEKRAYSTYVSAEQRRPQGYIGGQICVVILARALSYATILNLADAG